MKGVGYGMGVAVGDYDNDGYEDLYVTGYGGNRLYHNNGNCTFTDVTDKAGVGGSGWSTCAAWVDLDNDGRLDLVVIAMLSGIGTISGAGTSRRIPRLLSSRRLSAHYDAGLPQRRQRPFHRGSRTSSASTSRPRLWALRSAITIATAGLISLSPTTRCRSFSFTRKQIGTFEEVGLEAGVAVDGDGRTYAGMGVDFADYNNDGLPDLVVTDLANQKYALYQNDRRRHF